MLDTPFIRLLETYGINARTVPQETRIGHSADGITIEQFATDSDGHHVTIARTTYAPIQEDAE